MGARQGLLTIASTARGTLLAGAGQAHRERTLPTMLQIRNTELDLDSPTNDCPYNFLPGAQRRPAREEVTCTGVLFLQGSWNTRRSRAKSRSSPTLRPYVELESGLQGVLGGAIRLHRQH